MVAVGDAAAWSEADWSARMRADFPYRPGRVYLESAGAGLPVPGAAEAAAEHFRELGRLGAKGQPGWHDRAAQLRDRTGLLLGVPASEVQFFRGTSELLILAAASIRWRPGDEILVLQDDFPSVRLPWAQAEAAGAVMRWVESGDREARTEQLLTAITPRTRVVAVTHVHATTGTRVDLGRLGRACREVDALLLVDGIEALGAVPVDLEHVDVYSAAVFKWLLSGMGLGVGYVSPRAREAMTPASRGYRNPPPSDRLEYMEPPFPLLDVFARTLDYVGELGWPAVHARVDALAASVRHVLAEAGLEIVTPANARAGILSARHADAGGLVDELAARGIDVIHKFGLLRVSPHFYNTHEDVERFAAALGEALAARRQRPRSSSTSAKDVAKRRISSRVL